MTSLMVYRALQIRNFDVSFVWLRLYIPKYVDQYKIVTRQETGKIGPLYYHWLVSINLVLLAVVGAFASVIL